MAATPALKIVFESDAWVVVDKPSGWLTVPGRQHSDDRLCVGTVLSQQLNQRLWPVHRLDFEVSGLVLFAKNPEAHRRANFWFENRLVKKNLRGLDPFSGRSALSSW